MNLYSMLGARAEAGRPVRVGLIGAGKFGSMVLAQAQRIAGLQIVGLADLDVGKARASLARVGWPAERYAATSLDDAMRTGGTCVLDDALALAAYPGIECIIEATGHPIAGIRHGLAAIEGGKHVVMVNVEADVLCGPLLAERARARGVVYSMAYGDQPALICELVDWARSCGFELTAAGKGMNFEPRYRYSTPDTVWGFFGWTEEQVAKGDFNPKMYNSFTDGTKAAIEMAAVANGTGLDCPDDGLAFPPAGLHDLARVFRPAADGGRLSRSGLLDIAASQEPDGREVFNNIRYGVFVTFKKSLLCCIGVGPVEGIAGAHTAHGEKLKLYRFAAQPGGRFEPIDLRFLAPLIGLRHEDFPALQAEFALALPDVAPDCWLADGKFRMLRPQPHPDTMCRVALFARGLAVFIQHAVDVLFDRSQLWLLPNCFLPLGRCRTADRLPDHATVNAVLLRQSLNRLSGCMPQPDLLE